MSKAFMVLVLICSGCGRVPAKTHLGAAITEAVSRGEATTVDLDALANFEWDEVCFVGAFMRPADITAKLGFTWKGKRSGSRGNFIFVDVRSPRSDSTATGQFAIPRNQWFVDASGCIPRSQAKFVVRLQASGPATLVPVYGRSTNQPVTPFL
jgi:hypothetical protein